MRELTVYEPGTHVKIGGSVAARIAAVRIKELGSVCYEVVWINSGARCREWVEGFEIEPIVPFRAAKIGFLRND